MSAVSATCMVTLIPDKVTTIHTRERKPIPTQRFAEVVFPVGYPDAQKKISAEHVVRAALFSIEDIDVVKKKTREVPTEVGMRMGVRFASLNDIQIPMEERSKVVSTTVAGILSGNTGLKNALVERMSPVAKFIPEEGRFDVPMVRKYTENVDRLWQLIDANRKIRGADQCKRHTDTVGYYYGHMSHHMVKAAWAVSDILKLGKMYNVKHLEVTKMEGVISMYVCQSLVTAGWTIRVINGIGLPSYTGESRGLFSYFPFTKRVYAKYKKNFEGEDKDVVVDEVVKIPYLQYIFLDDKAPTISGQVVKYESDKEVLQQKIKQNRSVMAIPFFYTYYRPKHERYEDFEEFLGFQPMATAHAHSAQIIFSKRSAGTKFNFEDYRKRVAEANAWKTFYVYRKRRYWEHDPFGFKVDIALVNLQARVMSTVEYEFKDDNSPINAENFLKPEVINDKSMLHINPRSEKVELAVVEEIEKYNNMVNSLASGGELSKESLETKKEMDLEAMISVPNSGQILDEVVNYATETSEGDGIIFEDDQSEIAGSKNQQLSVGRPLLNDGKS